MIPHRQRSGPCQILYMIKTMMEFPLINVILSESEQVGHSLYTLTPYTKKTHRQKTKNECPNVQEATKHILPPKEEQNSFPPIIAAMHTQAQALMSHPSHTQQLLWHRLGLSVLPTRKEREEKKKKRKKKEE